MDEETQLIIEHTRRGKAYLAEDALAAACRELVRALVHAERSGDAVLQLEPLSLLGRAYCLLGKFTEAAAMLEQAAALPARSPTGDAQRSLFTYGTALSWLQGRLPAGFGTEDPPARDDAPPAHLLALGFGATVAGRFEHAVGFLSRASRTEAPAGPRTRAAAFGWLGYLALHTGNVDRAARYLQRGLGAAADRGAPITHRPIFLAARAELVLGGGNVRAAVRQAEEALELAEQTQQPLAQALCRQALVRMVSATPNPDWRAAEEMIQETKLYCQREGAVPLMAIAVFEQGRLFVAEERLKAAQDALNDALARFQTLGMAWYALQAQLALAALNR